MQYLQLNIIKNCGSIILLAILILFPIYIFYQYLESETGVRQKSSSIQPCLNPNCIRCQNYDRIQKSARCRLPLLLRHNYRHKDDGCKDLLERIAKGVRSDIIITSSSSSTLMLWRWWCQTITMSFSSIFRFRNKNKNIDNKENSDDHGVVLQLAPAVSGQYPTVLLVPGLSVQPIVTYLHTKTISFFVPPLCSSLPSNNHIMTNHLTTQATTAPIHEILLHEYIQTQRHGQWLVNDTTAIKHNNINKNDTAPSFSPCWKVLHLINQGRKIQCNLDLCPQTQKIIKSLCQKDHCRGHDDDDVLMEGCMFGNVFFSVLYPGTRIEPHCGPSNVRHRMHFALSAPLLSSSKRSLAEDGRGGLVMKVDRGGFHGENDGSSSVKIHWETGEAFVFDDSLVHEVEYYSGDGGKDDCDGGVQQHEETLTSCRVVLIVDLWHPDLTAMERRLLRDLYPAV